MGIKKHKTLFEIVGLETSYEYYRSRKVVELLHESFPDKIVAPKVYPLTDIDWEDFKTNLRCIEGWRDSSLKYPICCYVNGKYIGGHKEMMECIFKDYYVCPLKILNPISFYEKDPFQRITKHPGKDYVYFDIRFDREPIGRIVFELHSDLLPETCQKFKNSCKRESEDPYSITYSGSRIYRLVTDGWIEGGEISEDYPNFEDENYLVAHNKRGTLSMNNSGKKGQNRTQFIVLLSPQPWMDGKYVGFGQVVIGSEILTKINLLETYYGNPRRAIVIEEAGVLEWEEEEPEGLRGVRSDLKPTTKASQEAEGKDINRYKEFIKKIEEEGFDTSLFEPLTYIEKKKKADEAEEVKPSGKKDLPGWVWELGRAVAEEAIEVAVRKETAWTKGDVRDADSSQYVHERFLNSLYSLGPEARENLIRVARSYRTFLDEELLAEVSQDDMKKRVSQEEVKEDSSRTSLWSDKMVSGILLSIIEAYFEGSAENVSTKSSTTTLLFEGSPSSDAAGEEKLETLQMARKLVFNLLSQIGEDESSTRTSLRSLSSHTFPTISSLRISSSSKSFNSGSSAETRLSPSDSVKHLVSAFVRSARTSQVGEPSEPPRAPSTHLADALSSGKQSVNRTQSRALTSEPPRTPSQEKEALDFNDESTNEMQNSETN